MGGSSRAGLWLSWSLPGAERNPRCHRRKSTYHRMGSPAGGAFSCRHWRVLDSLQLELNTGELICRRFDALPACVVQPVYRRKVCDRCFESGDIDRG
ncbi:hypothetical protein Nepgr_020917 [Nepenthes gracilis]|uniref:Uncharacterized protein n=1 Tax=Nepenthes gracilis TaxID=150966 RepID=A0AAD3SY57_NEPGR|nr:hypothetical protein Nepgr_020917 [Nepenthes gracilis]